MKKFCHLNSENFIHDGDDDDNNTHFPSDFLKQVIYVCVFLFETSPTRAFPASMLLSPTFTAQLCLASASHPPQHMTRSGVNRRVVAFYGIENKVT